MGRSNRSLFGCSSRDIALRQLPVNPGNTRKHPEKTVSRYVHQVVVYPPKDVPLLITVRIPLLDPHKPNVVAPSVAVLSVAARSQLQTYPSASPISAVMPVETPQDAVQNWGCRPPPPLRP
jgi:hypothetical protein